MWRSPEERWQWCGLVNGNGDEVGQMDLSL